MQVGLKLFAEVFPPMELVRQAVLAEQVGFDFVEMSDHFHPWLDQSDDLPLAGHAGFAWSVLANIAARTTSIRLGTGVTCPTMRYHPAVIAQAAATMSILSDNRFFLGIGSGERLNEHIVGRGWAGVPVRHEMLREALHIINSLFSGGFHSFNGKHLQLEDARIYDLPEQPPEIIVAAAGPRAARIAADFGGMFTTGNSDFGEVVRTYRLSGGSGTVLGEMYVAHDPRSKRAGLTAATRSFRWAALGTAAAEIPRPGLFETATQLIGPDALNSVVIAGPDPADYLAQAKRMASDGMDGISFITTSPDIDRFIDFAAEHLIEPIREL
jgi:G6PDH family F420-dependent oxidoreductase